MRIIDGSELYNIEKLLDTEIIQKSPEASWLLSQVLHDIQASPEIDPETLPVVQQLRAELEKVKAERDTLVKIFRDLAFKSKPCFLCKRWGKKCSDSFHLCDKRNGYWEFCGVKED